MICDEDGWCIEDLDSLNGVFVHHIRVCGIARLLDRDLVQIGEALFRYLATDGPSPGTPS